MRVILHKKTGQTKTFISECDKIKIKPDGRSTGWAQREKWPGQLIEQEIADRAKSAENFSAKIQVIVKEVVELSIVVRRITHLPPALGFIPVDDKEGVAA